MTKKKGILGKLFGGSSGGCNCGMEITEEKPQKKGAVICRLLRKRSQNNVVVAMKTVPIRTRKADSFCFKN